MILVSNIHLKNKNINTEKKYLFKSIYLNFFFIFSSFFISQNIFAGDIFSRIRDTVLPLPGLNLLIAICKKDTELVQKLLQRGADPNLKDKNNVTLLHLASRDDQLQIAQMLINAKADLNVREEIEGWTPLHGAIFFKQFQTVKMLMNAGADITIKDKNGRTPLQLAIQYESDVEVVKMLLNGGADPFLDFRDTTNSLKVGLQLSTLRSSNLNIMRFICRHNAFTKNLSPARKLKLIAFAIDKHVSSEIIQLLIASGQKFPLKSIIERRCLKKVVEVFEKINNHHEDNHNIWNNNTRLPWIYIQGINVFVPLLLQYRYELQDGNISDSVKELVEKISNLNTTEIDIDHLHRKMFLDLIKSLIDWITHQMPSPRSSEEFFQQIFQYLRSKKHSPEEQNLLLENIQYLMLHEYLLNPEISDRSDFEQLKRTLKDTRLDNFQKFENDLRYIYAQELMVKFFCVIKEEDLMNAAPLDTQTNQQQNESMLKKFSLMNDLVDSMVSYCQDMNYSLTENDPAVKNTSSLIRSVAEEVQRLQNDTMAKLSESIKDKSRFSMLLFIENILKQGYSQRIGKQLHELYKHLGHIIQTKGADINSETSLKGKDILNLKK